MLTPEATQFLVDMALWALFVGSMAGFICSRMLERACDLVLYLIQRHDRIEAARSRDHALVPVMRWEDRHEQ